MPITVPLQIDVGPLALIEGVIGVGLTPRVNSTVESQPNELLKVSKYVPEVYKV
jgi:hypothetical protein